MTYPNRCALGDCGACRNHDVDERDVFSSLCVCVSVLCAMLSAGVFSFSVRFPSPILLARGFFRAIEEETS